MFSCISNFFALIIAFSFRFSFWIVLFDLSNSEEGDNVVLVKEAEKDATIEAEGRGSGSGSGEEEFVSNNGGKTGNSIELNWVVVVVVVEEEEEEEEE
jgi:hypothetical protein